MSGWPRRLMTQCGSGVERMQGSECDDKLLSRPDVALAVTLATAPEPPQPLEFAPGCRDPTRLAGAYLAWRGPSGLPISSVPSGQTGVLPGRRLTTSSFHFGGLGVEADRNTVGRASIRPEFARELVLWHARPRCLPVAAPIALPSPPSRRLPGAWPLKQRFSGPTLLTDSGMSLRLCEGGPRRSHS